jgi:hypothetical protein
LGYVIKARARSGPTKLIDPIDPADAAANNFKSGKSPRFPESGGRRRPGQDFSVAADFRGANPKQRGQIKRPPAKTRSPPSDDNNFSMTMVQRSVFS